MLSILTNWSNNGSLNLKFTIIFQEKGKYEVITGTQKLPEDLADFWSEILGRYPSVIAVIDPTRKAVIFFLSFLSSILSLSYYA